MSADRRAYQKAYREANRERLAAYAKAYAKDNEEHLKAWRDERKEYKSAYNKDYAEANEERLKDYRDGRKEISAAQNKARDQANPGRRNAISAAYRARRRSLTPSWYCDWMVREIYEGCPEGMEVDHIQSLAQGGLHSHENLQYLTIAENRSKGDSERGR